MERKLFPFSTRRAACTFEYKGNGFPLVSNDSIEGATIVMRISKLDFENPKVSANNRSPRRSRI